MQKESVPVTLDAKLNAGPQPSIKDKMGKLAELLERSGIDPDEIGRVERINVWQGFLKDENGEAQLVDMAGIVLSPQWADGPTWDPVNQGPAVKLPTSKVTKAPKRTEWNTAVVLPDMQIGYFRNAMGELEGIHDEAAIDICVAMIKDLKPTKIVMHGDNLDFAEFGKYRLSPAYALTTQKAIDYATVLMARLRAAAPDSEIVWLAGNHEERLVNYILDNARVSFGLKRGDSPDNFPVLSVPFLCRFDDFNIQYIAGYPAGYYWINQKLKVIHGTRVKSNGSTAHMYLSNEKTSILYGHIHRREWAEITREDFDGRKTILAASAGCLARVDGAVPSTKGGIDLDGRPMAITENWQQGLCVVTYKDGDAEFNLEMIPIRDGWAMYHNKEYTA